jgi:hypothetical protein
MNRFGFGLLTLGFVLAALGSWYRADWATLPGLALLAILTVLAALFPMEIAYDPERESQPLGRWEQRVWGAFYLSGFVLFGLAFWHTTAGGDGWMVMIGGLGLVAALAVYDAFHHSRFRASRLAALRAWRRQGSSSR